MPNKKINQLDPFADDKDEYSAQKIRRSRSRETKRLIRNVVNPEVEEKEKRTHKIIAAVLITVILVALGIIVVLKLTSPSEDTLEEDPLVNPTGREATSEYADTSADDPELRASETEKLDTVLALLGQEDWEYANALFETIFPRYLDNCGRYDYYRAAVLLADNFEGFTISRETAEARMNALVSKCSR